MQEVGEKMERYRHKKENNDIQETFDEFSNLIGKTTLITIAFAIVVSVGVATVFIVGVMLQVGIATILVNPVGLLLAGIFLAIVGKMAYAIVVYAIQNRGDKNGATYG